jgi:hypothetical protein
MDGFFDQPFFQEMGTIKLMGFKPELGNTHDSSRISELTTATKGDIFII